MKSDSQNAAILAYVRKRHFITRMDAFRHCGCCNLWARIAELEELPGIKFDRRPVKTRTGKRVLQYWLRPSRAAQRKAA